MRHLTVLSGLILSLLGCATEPSKDEPLPTDSRYPGWYRETVACSGKSGNYRELTFWVLEDDSPLAGQTWGKDIYIKERYRTSAFVVKHEMLHTLLGGDAHHLHPAWSACGLRPR